MPFVKIRIDINPTTTGFGVGEFKRDFMLGSATERLVLKGLVKQIFKRTVQVFKEYNIERKAKDSVPT